MDRRFNFLRRRFTPTTVFLEVGYCELALRAANWVERVYAIDLPPSIVRNVVPPSNMRMEFAVPDESVHIAYTEKECDVERVYRALRPGGVFFSTLPISFRRFKRVEFPWFKPIRVAAWK